MKPVNILTCICNTSPYKMMVSVICCLHFFRNARSDCLFLYESVGLVPRSLFLTGWPGPTDRATGMSLSKPLEPDCLPAVQHWTSVVVSPQSSLLTVLWLALWWMCRQALLKHFHRCVSTKKRIWRILDVCPLQIWECVRRNARWAISSCIVFVSSVPVARPSWWMFLVFWVVEKRQHRGQCAHRGCRSFLDDLKTSRIPFFDLQGVDGLQEFLSENNTVLWARSYDTLPLTKINNITKGNYLSLKQQLRGTFRCSLQRQILALNLQYGSVGNSEKTKGWGCQ